MLATVVPVLVLGLPIFDTAFAILRRLVNKRPIMEADKGHLHHRIMAVGLGQERTVLTLYGISDCYGDFCYSNEQKAMYRVSASDNNSGYIYLCICNRS